MNVHNFFAFLIALLLSACNPSLSVVMNKSEAYKNPAVENVLPLIAKSGETVTFTGIGMKKNTHLSINGVTFPVTMKSHKEGVFTITADLSPGLKTLVFNAGTDQLGTFTIIADTAGDGIPIMPIAADKVCRGQQFRDAEGNLQVGSRICGDQKADFCAYDGATECVTSESLPAISKSQLLAELPKIHASVSIAGIYGTMKDCSNSERTACRVDPNSSFKALVGANVDATKILQTYDYLGVEGTLGVCSINGSANCYASGTFFAAETCLASGSNCYLPNYNVATQPLKAVNVDVMTPGVIRDGVTIAGVTGDYPSAIYPLLVSDGFSDITTGNFASSLSTLGTFAWFDSSGTRHSKVADADLTSASIRSPVNILGTVGSLAVPSIWNVRQNVASGSSGTGQIQARCNNRSNLSIRDIFAPYVPASGLSMDFTSDTLTIPGHGLSSGDSVYLDFYSGAAAPLPLDDTTVYYVIRMDDDVIKLAATYADATNVILPVPIDLAQDGAQVIVYKIGSTIANALNTVDDANAGLAMSLLTNWMTDTSEICEGVEATVDDSAAWKRSSTLSCAADPANCVMRDKISNLDWTKIIGTSNWAEAVLQCDELSYDGKSDWRLPTMPELVSAYIHGMRSAASADWILNADFTSIVWASTTYSPTVEGGFIMRLSDGAGDANLKFDNRPFLCVRNP